jgi:hypothetical protein
MAADDLEQPDWPLRFTTLPDGSVQLADTAQDSDEDLKARAAVACSIRRGSLVYEPTVGITPLPFQTRGVDTARLASEIQQTDPGLEVSATEAMDALDHTHRYVHTAVAPNGEGS